MGKHEKPRCVTDPVWKFERAIYCREQAEKFLLKHMMWDIAAKVLFEEARKAVERPYPNEPIRTHPRSNRTR